MRLIAQDVLTRPATIADASLVHRLYTETPKYFDIISIPMPTHAEIRRELEAASQDPRRCVELALDGAFSDPANIDKQTGKTVVGYLDYKLDYPDPGDATVNLLLIREGLQSRGYGRKCMADLEQRLGGHVKRILASVYGQNTRAKHFWDSLGYSFAIDARPVLEWYAKELTD